MSEQHGWVTPRPDGRKAKCMGPPACDVCTAEAAAEWGSALRMGASASLVIWHEATDPIPPPSTPYRLFLVWLRGEGGPITGGVAAVGQWDRKAQAWTHGTLTGYVVTHWAEMPRPAAAGPEFRA